MTNEITGVLEGHAEYAPWKPIVGEVTSALQDNFVRSGMLPAPAAAQQVVNEAIAVLATCGNPSALVAPKTGLVCGYVQSGKTASMTAVAALGKDNGYRIVILLAGVTTILLDQNKSRLEADLRAATPEWAWFMLTNPRLRENRHDLESLVTDWLHEEEDDQRTLFITVMKHASHLRRLADFLASSDLSRFPALIFDDEADQASLDTRPRTGVPSPTYSAIARVRAALRTHAYLQYTATPQAPLLIARIDSLSADFAELVSPGDGYTGGREFFGEANDLVARIPSTEIFRDDELPEEPPASLLAALRLFFVGVAAERTEPGRTHKHRSMLIHPSKATATQALYYRWTNELRREWHGTLLAEGDPDRIELLAEFQEAHRQLEATAPGLPSFERICGKLVSAVNRATVTLVNSVDGREVPWSNGYAHILVGGEKLGRGYTVKGLTVTYMPRSPGTWTADTIQQRARFFGYHRAYLGYSRIFLHPDVSQVYGAYVEHEEDMRSRLAEYRGRPLRDWKRTFYLERRLAPTRRNVLTSPYVRPRLSQGWLEPRAPHRSPRDGAANLELVRRLDPLRFEPDDEHPQHQVALVRLKDVFEQVLVPLSYLDENDALGLCVVNCNLQTQIERDEAAECVVYLMSHGALRLRRLTRGFVPELFQGPSGSSYPGDRQFSHPTMPTIQVHMLRIVDGDRELVPVPAIAVRVPGARDVLIHEEEDA